jgi:uncharacterized membrane protein YeaQ/YmgE (transglycosylase-associated protein family)
MLDLLWFLLIGAVVGWLAGLLVEGEGKGFWVNMVVGILGAVIGGYLTGVLPSGISNTLGRLGMAFLGSVVLLALIRLLRSSK